MGGRARQWLVVALPCLLVLCGAADRAAAAAAAAERYCLVEASVQPGGLVSLAGDVSAPVPAVLKTIGEVPLQGQLGIVFPTGGCWRGGRGLVDERRGAPPPRHHMSEARWGLAALQVVFAASGPARCTARRHTVPPTTPARTPGACPSAADLPSALAGAWLSQPGAANGGLHIDKLEGAVEMEGTPLGTIAIQGQRVRRLGASPLVVRRSARRAAPRTP
jgi:hypothetical protein